MTDAAWVALSLIRGIGARTFEGLLQTFGSAQAVLDAPDDQLRQVKGVGFKTAAAIKAANIEAVAASLGTWEASGVRVIDWNAADYPAALKTAPDAPPTLFIKGHLPVTMPRAVAIVGTRTPSSGARDIAERLACDLADAGIAIVSGLALGIDTAAHHAALAVPHGVTLAVLGSGLLKIYPPANRELSRAVERRGALLCEVTPDARVSAAGLVARNRIISGLCEAVVIVQTDDDGGTLHAARFAAAQGRTVYFIDDPLGSMAAARGIALLRAGGATPLSSDVSGSTWLK